MTWLPPRMTVFTHICKFPLKVLLFLPIFITVAPMADHRCKIQISSGIGGFLVIGRVHNTSDLKCCIAIVQGFEKWFRLDTNCTSPIRDLILVCTE